MKPFGFTDYIHLQQHAKCVISDSGTISEESAILGFPAISLRQSMERPEAQDAGTIILTGFDPEIVLQSIDLVIKEFSETDPSPPAADQDKPETRNPEPGTRNQKPETRNQKPETRNQKPETRNQQIPWEYMISDTSWRVLKLIMGNARLSNKWWGIHERDPRN